MHVSCETTKTNELNVSNMLSSDDLGVCWVNEDEMAARSNNKDFLMPCGHDCCTCDSECK